MGLNINIYNSSSLKYLPKKKIKRVVENVLSGEGIENAEISLIFAGDDLIRDLNKKYLQHDYPTDVIAFALEEKEIEYEFEIENEIEKIIDGEIYIGVEVAKEQAEEYCVSLTNEIKRLAAHGTLHLAGYDDSTAELREQMRHLEDKYIK